MTPEDLDAVLEILREKVRVENQRGY